MSTEGIIDDCAMDVETIEQELSNVVVIAPTRPTAVQKEASAQSWRMLGNVRKGFERNEKIFSDKNININRFAKEIEAALDRGVGAKELKVLFDIYSKATGWNVLERIAPTVVADELSRDRDGENSIRLLRENATKEERAKIFSGDATVLEEVKRRIANKKMGKTNVV